MRIRITGRRLLPVALAATSILAMAAPASARQEPPDPLSHEQDMDCVRALSLLSILRLLPNTPEDAKALCSGKEAKTPDQATRGSDDEATRGPDDESTRGSDASDSGALFGLPDLPEGLAVQIAGLVDKQYANTRGER